MFVGLLTCLLVSCNQLVGDISGGVGNKILLVVYRVELGLRDLLVEWEGVEWNETG